MFSKKNKGDIMAIQAVNGLTRAASFGLTNPIRNLGSLAITMFAVHIISNLPKAEAWEGHERVCGCQSLCEPLPGGKSYDLKQICMKTCQKICSIKLEFVMHVFNLFK